MDEVPKGFEDVENSPMIDESNIILFLPYMREQHKKMMEKILASLE